jgi:hypothetical protein
MSVFAQVSTYRLRKDVLEKWLRWRFQDSTITAEVSLCTGRSGACRRAGTASARPGQYSESASAEQLGLVEPLSLIAFVPPQPRDSFFHVTLPAELSDVCAHSFGRLLRAVSPSQYYSI